MTDFSKQVCMLCSNTGLCFVDNLRDDDDHWVAECLSCGHIQQTPLPTVEEDNEYYQKNEMSRRLVSKMEMDDWAMMMKYEEYGEEHCNIISKIIPSIENKILEIGSGYGWFVEKMRAKGYFCDGIELSDEKRAMALKRSKTELLSYNLLIDDLPAGVSVEDGGGYDMICMFFVLEHILDPILLLTKSLSMLKPGGRLLAVVPNYFDHLKLLCDEYNAFTYFRAHLSYFKPETLRLLFEKIGLTDVNVVGKQVYSLENAIHWLRVHKPCVEKIQVKMPNGLEWIGDIYKNTLEKDLVSDQLVIIGKK
jgi:2-polyprenyl-3-methyl-5-hydroxy-6-metoxy-1,4-benzoquinol methylase